MLLSTLLENIGEYRLFGEKNTEISGICPDSKRIKLQELYVAIEGIKNDGHRYISEAFSKGASAAVVSMSAINDGRISKELENKTLIAVDDTRAAMAHLYSALYGHSHKKIKMIGVTGTNGKTSVCRMLYEILTRAGHTCGLIGTTGAMTQNGKIDIRPANVEANMTTPDPEELYKILDIMAGENTEFCVMEVTSHALALKKVEPIKFSLGIFTNLSEDHLDFHRDMEEYFEAKQKLFSLCEKALINYDDKYGRRLAEALKIPTYTCSSDGRSSDFTAVDIRQCGEKGIEYKLSSSMLRLRVRSRMLGDFNVKNTMQAAIGAHLLGVGACEIRMALADFSGIDGRLQKLKSLGRADFSVYIDYAHTPDALEKLILTARAFAMRGQRIVVLFGCGGDREKQKRAIMGNIATSLADFVIITSDNSRSEKTVDVINDILSGVKQEACYTVIESRKDAIEYAVKNARRGDIILLAGKGHEEYEIDASGKRPFSERLLVEELMKKYYC